MWKLIKLFVLIMISISTLNLFAWLFVVSLDVMALGSGRAKYSESVRALLSFADRVRPYVELLPSVHRRVGAWFGMEKYYYSTWILTIAVESALAALIAYGVSKVIRLSRSTNRP